mmetsp:Transcript_30383/g.85265  ORF Transcript_30383/g.85265 Transcript_30383/m.85265 type:complete len:173 (-) Transcript_30383:51-569(-)
MLHGGSAPPRALRVAVLHLAGGALSAALLPDGSPAASSADDCVVACAAVDDFLDHLQKNNLGTHVWMRLDSEAYFKPSVYQINIDTARCIDITDANLHSATCTECIWFDTAKVPFGGDSGTSERGIQAGLCLNGSHQVEDMETWMRRDRLVHEERYKALCAVPDFSDSNLAV